MTLNLIETFKTSIYIQKIIKNTKIYSPNSIFQKLQNLPKNNFKNFSVLCYFL